jgi:hypothetical protein
MICAYCRTDTVRSLPVGAVPLRKPGETQCSNCGRFNCQKPIAYAGDCPNCEALRQRVETLEGALMASREVHVDAWSLLMRQEVDSALLDKRDAAFRLIEAALTPQEGE